MRKMSKRKVSRILSFICALTIIFTTSAPLSTSAETVGSLSDSTKYEIDGYTIKNVADVTKLPAEFDGQGQNYGWSTTEYGDYIYIGTGNNIIGNAANMISDTVLKNIPGITEDEAAKISDNLWKLVFNGQLPSRNGHAILLKVHKETYDVTVITPEYDDTKVTGYRNAVVYKDTLYFVAAAPKGGLVKINPVTNKSSYVYQPKEGGPGAYRGLYIYDGELLFSFGTVALTETGVKYGAVIQSSSTPESPDSWKTIANEVNFDQLPSSGELALASGGGIWEMVNYKGKLYVSIATNNDENNHQRGFALYRGDKHDGKWNWTPVIGLPEKGAKYPLGLGRNTPVTLSLFEYNGYLYLGEFNNTPYNLIMAVAGNLMNPASENKLPPGDLKPLYDALNQPVNLYRMNADENIELVIGDDMENIPRVTGQDAAAIHQSGFGDHNLQYIWWMQEYDGKLFVGTFDISTLTNVLKVNPADMTKEEFKQRLQHLIDLISSILEALDMGEIPQPTAADLEDYQIDSSILAEPNVDAEDLEGLLSNLPKADLEQMLQQLIQLANQSNSDNGSDMAVTYEDLKAIYEEKILPALSGGGELDPALMPIMERISAILDSFFGSLPVEQYTYYQAIKEYTKNATMGYDVFYTEDGVNFKALTRDGLGHPESYGLRTFLRSSDALYFTTSGPFNGFEVWKLQSKADQTTKLVLDSAEDTLTASDDITATFNLKEHNINAFYQVFGDETHAVPLDDVTATVDNNKLVLTLNKPVTESTIFYVTAKAPEKFESGPVAVTVHPYKMNSDATLAKLNYSVNGKDGVSVPDFSPAVYEYNVTLPSGTAQDAVITLSGEAANKLASITSNPGVTLKDGKGTAVIKVAAEDGTILTYSVKFNVNNVKQAAVGSMNPNSRGVLPNTGGILNPIIYTILLGLSLLVLGGVLLFINRRTSKLI